MTIEFEYKGAIARRNAARVRFEQLRAEGAARLLLEWLPKLAVPASDEARERIINCPDRKQIDRWADRAASEYFTSMDDMFAREREEAASRVLLTVLKLVGIPVGNKAAYRIMSCTDAHQVERWAKRITMIDSADELFD